MLNSTENSSKQIRQNMRILTLNNRTYMCKPIYVTMFLYVICV